MTPDSTDTLLTKPVKDISQVLSAALNVNCYELKKLNDKIAKHTKSDPLPRDELLGFLETDHLFRPRLDNIQVWPDLVEERNRNLLANLARPYAIAYAWQLLHKKLIEHGMHSQEKYLTIQGYLGLQDKQFAKLSGTSKAKSTIKAPRSTT